MGRNNHMTVKQYGRHRQRVILADNWSGSDSREDLFSCSANSSQECMSSDTSSYIPTRNRNKQLSTLAHRNSKKKSFNQDVNKENRCVKQYKKKGTSEKHKYAGIFSLSEDSHGSTGSEKSSLNRSKRKCRRQPLKTCNGQRTVQSTPSRNNGKESVNFSEFDEYSLLVESGTTNLDENTRLKKANKSSIETSTPYKKSRPVVNKRGIKDVNISVIDYVESPVERNQDNVIPSDIVSPSSELLGVSEIVSNLSHTNSCSPHSEVMEPNVDSVLPSPKRTRSASLANYLQQSQDLFDSPVYEKTNSKPATRLIYSPSQCYVHLKKLKDSFLNGETHQRNNNVMVNQTRNKIFEPKSRETDKKSKDSHDVSDCDVDNISNHDDVAENEDSDWLDTEADSDDDDADEDEDFNLSDILEDEEDSDDNVSINSDLSDDEESRYMLIDGSVDGEQTSEMKDGNKISCMELSAALQEEDGVGSTSDGETSQCVMSDSTRNDSSHQLQLNCSSQDSSLHSLLELSFKEMLTPGKKNKTSLSPKSKILDICQQKDFITFRKCIPNRVMKTAKKIGEGVFGEVFRATRNRQSVAIKIVPIEGNQEINDEPQKNFAEILSEVVISRELSDLRQNYKNKTENFGEVKSVSCVKGSYPAHLLKQWDQYDEAKKSENDRPDLFPNDQLFMVFEFADGGQDLESFKFDNPFQAKSVLQQVCMSLAVAEESLEFEHRDLHIGNVLVCQVDHPSITCRLCDTHFEVDSHGVHVSIIDFTLSRLKKDGCIVFCDLSKDDSLYEGTGDYQFDIYRKMKEENKNNWKPFNSHSNVLWIHYVCDKILRRKKYRCKGREDRSALQDMKLFFKEALNYQSAKHILFESTLF